MNGPSRQTSARVAPYGYQTHRYLFFSAAVNLYVLSRSRCWDLITGTPRVFMARRASSTSDRLSLYPFCTFAHSRSALEIKPSFSHASARWISQYPNPRGECSVVVACATAAIQAAPTGSVDRCASGDPDDLVHLDRLRGREGVHPDVSELLLSGLGRADWFTGQLPHPHCSRLRPEQPRRNRGWPLLAPRSRL